MSKESRDILYRLVCAEIHQCVTALRLIGHGIDTGLCNKQLQENYQKTLDDLTKAKTELLAQ